MRLLEIISAMTDCDRIAREKWEGQYLCRNYAYPYAPLILCNFNCKEMDNYMFTYEDFIVFDWEFLK